MEVDPEVFFFLSLLGVEGKIRYFGAGSNSRHPIVTKVIKLWFIATYINLIFLLTKSEQQQINLVWPKH